MQAAEPVAAAGVAKAELAELVVHALYHMGLVVVRVVVQAGYYGMAWMEAVNWMDWVG
ncbi:MAG: hypothetical protein NVSMB44_24240 [Ktedonobacteraceae bacterium]